MEVEEISALTQPTVFREESPQSHAEIHVGGLQQDVSALAQPTTAEPRQQSTSNNDIPV